MTTVVLRKWKVSPTKASFEFELDAASHRAVVDFFDMPLLSPLERQAGLLYLLSAFTSKPVRASALSAHVEQILIATDVCDRPRAGWHCTRRRGHDGPCAAVPRETLPKTEKT